MIALLNKYVFGVGVPVLLIISGVFYCVRLRAFYFFHPIKSLKRMLSREKRGGVSPLKALCLALAGTLGVGNMVGVASAIALGGCGAVFWMWVSALVAMSLKYAEIVVAMRHRRFDNEGKPHGAAMYYITDLFGGRTAGRILSVIFALLCLLNAVSMGGMIQIKAAADAANGVFGVPHILIGGGFAVTAFCAMWRGSNGILHFTEKLVPFMTVGFVVISLFVVLTDIDGAYSAIREIFKNAFTIESGVSGVLGFLFSNALRYGTMRGILSNEAGCGTSPTAHAVSDCDIPAKQGLWGVLEVFVDTILLCTLTAIVIIMSGNTYGNDYMMMTVDAYSVAIGNVAGIFVAISVMLFGLATILCWGHYGMESVRYLSTKIGWGRAFIFVYCICVLWGSVLSGDMIWDMSDLAIGGMTFINLAVLLFMNREVVEETRVFWENTK